MYEGKDDSMMKKFMALFLALMFALLCTAAMAEGSTESVVSNPNRDHQVLSHIHINQPTRPHH